MRKLLLDLKKNKLSSCSQRFWQISLLLCFLKHRDDLKTLLQELQGYSKPSMCFSACSLALLILFDLKSHLVQIYPSRPFSIIDSIVAIVWGSTTDVVCLCFDSIIGIIAFLLILPPNFTCMPSFVLLCVFTTSVLLCL